MITLEPIAHPEERAAWLAVADLLRPVELVRPSEWARRYVRLRPEYTSRPGPYDPDVWPWGAAFLDSLYDDPGREGIVATKPSQKGFTLKTIILMHWAARFMPGPFLYVTTDHVKTREFCESYFMPIVKESPYIAELFNVEQDLSVLKYHKPYKGGVVDFESAATEKGLLSTGRRFIVLDEYERSSRAFAAKTGGDLWVAAKQRLERWEHLSILMAFGHPRFEGEDIHARVRDLSDQARWVFDCPLPGCGRVVEPHSDRLDFGVVGDAGDRDPGKARFVCPHCTREITDAQRARATWPPRLGGTGRYESPLEPDVARRRKYLGRSVNGFADPYKTVRHLAQDLCDCKTEEALLQQYNKGFGEPRKQSRQVITQDTIGEALKPWAGTGDIVLPGGDLGVKFLVTGADVQAPADNHVFYVAAVAFAASGMAYVTHLEKTQGWAAYFEVLRRIRVTVEGAGPMGVRLASIDAGRWTKEILDQQREPAGPGAGLYSMATSWEIKRLPMKYVPQLNEDLPSQMAPDRKRQHPTRNDLGLIRYYYLWRHHWVDRAIQRWVQKRVVLLCPEPPDFRAHMMANALRPAPKQHGLDRDREGAR